MRNAIFHLFIVLLLVLFGISANNSFAADYYWVNGAGNWHDGSHWSTSSGGASAGVIPSKNDNAFFDENSELTSNSLVRIDLNTSINDLTISESPYFSFYGGLVNMTISGNFLIRSTIGFYLTGNLILANESENRNRIETNDIDFNVNIHFEKGDWVLVGHLKTDTDKSIHFNSGSFVSSGYTVHAESIYANKNNYSLDFSGSHISTMRNFDVSKGINVGGKAIYLVLSDSVNPEGIRRFLRPGDETKDATVLCTHIPFTLDLLITSDYNGEDISCFDSCDGQITVIASGTPGPFSYRYGGAPNPFTALNVFDDLCVGSQSVTVIDSSFLLAPGIYDRCTVSDNLTEPPTISFDPPITVNPSCPGICDGQAFSFPVGGTAPITVFWPLSGETTTNPIALCVGDNPVVVSDINGCSIDAVVFISEPIQIIADPVITPPTCFGDCDAEILVNPAGGNGAPYTFNWIPAPPSGAGSNPGIGFCAGIFSLAITDVDGCEFDTTITVVNPPAMSVTLDGIIDASCNGVCDGEANANVVGGVAPYTFEWFDSVTGLTTGITDQTATGLCAGTYFVVVTDAQGCVRTSPIITIDEPPPFVLNLDEYDISCFGICDGALDIDVSGGSPPYIFSWTTVPGGFGVGATDSISGLCAGLYQIIVTDDNGCVSLPLIGEVLEPTEIDITLSSTNPTCYDLCDGTASALVVGGTPPYTYSWSPAPGAGGTTPNPTNMCDGIYTVTVTDDNGCTETNSITLTNPPSYVITSTITPLDCFGDTDAAIDIVVVSGGSGVGYTYTWFPAPPFGAGTPNVSGLGGGVWTVTIGDSEGCDTTLSFTITNPPAILLGATVISDVLCNGDCSGSASVTISGGTPPYAVLWDDPLAQISLTASGLCAGTYNVTVTDDNGCIAAASVTIDEPAPFDLTLSQVDLLCNGDCNGTATVTVNSGGVGPYTVLWDDPLLQTTLTAISLCAGTYTATLTDNNGCDTVLTFTLVEPPALTITVGLIDGACFGDCTGSAFVTFSGGTPIYSFEWFDAVTDLPLGVNNDTITGLCEGTFYAVITDGNGCTIQSADIVIDELPEIIATIVATTDATCDLCDGTAIISVAGGAGGFIYDWSPDPLTGEGTPSVTGLCSGVYTVSIVDAAGCAETLIVSIDDIAIEILDLDSIDVSCFGACDGQAIANFVPIDPPYTLEWFDNLTGLTTGIFGSPATGLCAGEYLAVLTNASGCVTTETIIVSEPTEITGIISNTDVTCDGLCDGTASIVISGGVPPYTYDWGLPLPGGGEGTPNAVGLCAGPWQVIVTDNIGCSITITTTIDNPSDIIILAESSTDVSCFGDSDGNASVIVAGGTPAYTYEWFDCSTGLPIGQTGPLATGLPAGSYQCVITDANGCTETSSCLIVNDAPAITAIINTENITCFGECNGLISVIPSGGVAPYFFQWLDEFGVAIPGQVNDSIVDLCSGTYNVRITDINGCIQVFGPIDMTSPSSPWVVLTSQTNITCDGFCDGTATVAVLDGNNPPYTYQWDDPFLQVTPTATFLCEGTWTVTISDAGVCDTTISFTIVDNDPVFANLTDQTDVLCYGECTGEITVNPSGGTAPYTLNWSDGQTGLTAVDLCAGDITLTITDGLGCTLDTSFTITEPTEITTLSSFSNNTNCDVCNGSATVNITGGVGPYTYDWTPDPLGGDGSNFAFGLCAGIVNVLVTDANGCNFIDVFAISDLTGEDVTVTSTDASCFGVCDGEAEAIYVCSEPVCTQEWFDGGTGLSLGITTSTITGLCAGDYFVVVTNGESCISIESVTIGSPTEILANEVIVPIVCAGDDNGSITLFPTGGSGGGYTYEWTPVPPNGDGTSEALDLSLGIWNVIITDGDGCEEDYSFNFSEPSPIIIDAVPTNVTCNGFCNGSILLSVSGGGGSYTFQWFMGGVLMPGETSALLAGICPGNYNVEVTDANGCVVTLPFPITISEPVPITATLSKTDITCFGLCDGTATVVPTGGVAPFIINWYDALTGSLIGISDPIATGLCAGTYFAVINDASGCSATSSDITIIEPSELTFTLATSDAGCFGFCNGTGTVVASGGTPAYIYEWLTILGDPIVGGTTSSVSDLCEGFYTVEIVDNNGCTTGLIPVVIDGNDEIIGSLFSNDAECGVPNGNATVFASGGLAPYNYQWFDVTMTALPGENNFTLLDVFSGIYFVTVTDAAGCSETFMVTISDSDAADVVFDTINNPTCFGECDGSIEITTTGDNPPFTYIWNPGGIIAEDPTALCADDYILQVTDALGCRSFFDVTLTDPPEIIATAVITPTECGECDGAIDLTLFGGTGAMTVAWNTGATGLLISDLCAGIYEAEITDANGCTVTQTFTVDNSSGFTGNPLVNAITCAESCDGEVIVTPVGGVAPFTYLWLHDLSTSNSLTGLCAGVYFIEITDATGCVTTVEVEMLDPNPIDASPTILNPSCGLSNGSITVMSSGGILPHTYLWSTGATGLSISGLDAGIYTLTITDANGCNLTFTFPLSNVNAPIIELTSTDVSCFGDCDGTIDTLSVSGGTPAYSYLWLDDLGTSLGITTPLITGLCAGDYLLQVTDNTGCISFQFGDIEEPDSIIINSLVAFDALCFGDCDGQLIANPIGGTFDFTFLWDDPSSQTTAAANGLCEGIYTVTITDANGCQVSQSGTIDTPDEITTVIDSIVPATCQDATDGEIYVTVTGGTGVYTYEWVSETFADTFNLQDPSGLLPMDYYLTITDENGCQYFDTLSVDTLISIIADAGPDTLVCFENSLLLIGSSNIIDYQTYTWYDANGAIVSTDSTLVIDGTISGSTFYVLEIGYAGCSDLDTVFITVTAEVLVDAGLDIDMYTEQSEVIGGSPTTDPTNTVVWTPSIFLNDSILNNPTVIQPTISTWYYVIATDTNGCINIDSIYVTVLPDIVIPDGISPGSDGKNDTWILDFTDQYPGAAIKINVYNRWGDLLFESDENYNDDWGGTTENGKRLPAGTYYYVIDIDHEDFPEPLTGPLTIMW